MPSWMPFFGRVNGVKTALEFPRPQIRSALIDLIQIGKLEGAFLASVRGHGEALSINAQKKPFGF
jgi:hypothetical protein